MSPSGEFGILKKRKTVECILSNPFIRIFIVTKEGIQLNKRRLENKEQFTQENIFYHNKSRETTNIVN